MVPSHEINQYLFIHKSKHISNYFLSCGYINPFKNINPFPSRYKLRILLSINVFEGVIITHTPVILYCLTKLPYARVSVSMAYQFHHAIKLRQAASEINTLEKGGRGVAWDQLFPQINRRPFSLDILYLPLTTGYTPKYSKSHKIKNIH